ncbi:alpha/beta fold hydrolase [Pararhodobacter sp.]|uniref:alpha/beta fold hydrolase n=1 Tax=Pararhodobacter sp. TaxID=2127056 RepID=UPI002AFEF201|nr:alpha/beta fold hydrolase [Pararhodobacter sp.]
MDKLTHANTDTDLERARLIGSIYETVLNPEHFDVFMHDWSSYVDQAARRLGELQVGAGNAGRLVNDPIVEAHFQRAFSLFERMGRGEDSPDPGFEGRVPLVRLGRRGVITDLTAEAEALFGAAPSLASIYDALDRDSATRLSAFLTTFERAPASGRFVVLSLAPTADTMPLDMPGGGLIAAVTCRASGGDGFVAELRPLAIGWSTGLAGVLSDSFNLTPREVELVHELSQGGDLAAIAERVDRSLNTLRAQLKSVFAKTRTGSQSELMRLVAVLVLHGPTTEAPVDPGLSTTREHRIDLGNGQFLPIHTLGPEDGLPVIFLHGMLEGLGVLQRIGSALEAENLRLVAPVRRNYGQSIHDPRIKEAPEIFAHDLAVILQKLGIEQCVVVGHMAGGIYAFAAAAHLPDKVVGVFNVSGCVPIKTIEQFSSMTPRQRAVAYTARFAPALLPAVLRAGIARIDSTDVKRFMVPLYPEGTRDRATVENPRIAAALIDGYRFTVAQGIVAFQVDSWHVTRNWGDLVAGCTCPVSLIHGQLDPVVTIGSVRDFARSNPRVTLNEIPREGQLVFHARPDMVIKCLARFARTCLNVAPP